MAKQKREIEDLKQRMKRLEDALAGEPKREPPSHAAHRAAIPWWLFVAFVCALPYR
jgi:hypothetical protein